MGSAGIKKRKKRRRANAEPEAHMSSGDVQRVFGRFSWGAYTPAGALERQGFFLRQLNRYNGGRWSILVVAARIVVLLVLAIFALGILAALATAFFH